ncbi:MAG: hypothetical protein ACOY3P_07135 [Planctomycetota bacterium]
MDHDDGLEMGEKFSAFESYDELGDSDFAGDDDRNHADQESARASSAEGLRGEDGSEAEDRAVSCDPAVIEEKSTEYVGRWNRLVSRTNWDKGRIIAAWRQALVSAGSPPSEYSDEAWSRRVGGVSPQHVGRLRRVHERFGRAHDQYAGLFWSHFHAAIDWPDAEMWLEGAARSGWSISQMREQRWAAHGAPADLKPRDEDIIQGELDEDAAMVETEAPPASIEGRVEEVESPEGEAPWEGEGDDGLDGEKGQGTSSEEPLEPQRPLAALGTLPQDLAEAFEAFKLAILAHKITGWDEISVDEVLASLEALKQLALSPSE